MGIKDQLLSFSHVNRPFKSLHSHGSVVYCMTPTLNFCMLCFSTIICDVYVFALFIDFFVVLLFVATTE